MADHIPIIKGRKGISLTETHKRHISEALRQKYGTSDYKEAFEKFIQDGMNSISYVAEKFVKYADKRDLIQDTVRKLYEKFHQYNPKLSEPQTYCSRFAKNEMWWFVKPDTLNTNEYKTLAKINMVLSENYSKTGKMLSPVEIAQKLKTSPEKIEKIMINGQDFIELDRKSYEDNNVLIGDNLSSDKLDIFSNPEDVMISTQMKSLLDNSLQTLTENERQIMILSTGYEDAEALSDRQIAKKLGVSNTQVAKIQKRAIKKMREYIVQFDDTIDKAQKIDSGNIIKVIIEYLNVLESELDRINNIDEIKDVVKSISDSINTINNYNRCNKQSPVSKTDDIRIRQRDPKIFNKSTMRTISLSKSLGIKAVIGQLPGDSKLRIQTLIFNRNPEFSKSWTLREAKDWTKENKTRVKISVDVKELLNNIQTGENK